MKAQIYYTDDFSYLISGESMSGKLVKKNFAFPRYKTRINFGDRITRLGSGKGGTFSTEGYEQYIGVFVEKDDDGEKSEWLIFEQGGGDGLFKTTLHTKGIFAYYAYLYLDDARNPLHYFTKKNGCQLVRPDIIIKA